MAVMLWASVVNRNSWSESNCSLLPLDIMTNFVCKLTAWRPGLALYPSQCSLASIGLPWLCMCFSMSQSVPHSCKIYRGYNYLAVSSYLRSASVLPVYQKNTVC